MSDYQQCPTCGSRLLVISRVPHTQHWLPVNGEQLAASQAREAALREVVEWYADPQNRVPRWIDEDGQMLLDSPSNLDMGMRARAALAADPGQAAERVRLLEKIARIAADETDHSPFNDWEWADDHRDLCDALEELVALATSGKAEEVQS